MYSKLKETEREVGEKTPTLQRFSCKNLKVQESILLVRGRLSEGHSRRLIRQILRSNEIDKGYEFGTGSEPRVFGSIFYSEKFNSDAVKSVLKLQTEKRHEEIPAAVVFDQLGDWYNVIRSTQFRHLIMNGRCYNTGSILSVSTVKTLPPAIRANINTVCVFGKTLPIQELRNVFEWFGTGFSKFDDFHKFVNSRCLTPSQCVIFVDNKYTGKIECYSVNTNRRKPVMPKPKQPDVPPPKQVEPKRDSDNDWEMVEKT